MRAVHGASNDARCLYLNFSGGNLNTVDLPFGATVPHSMSSKAAIGILTAVDNKHWLTVSWSLDVFNSDEHARLVTHYDPSAHVRMLDNLVDLRARWQRTGLAVRCRLFSGTIASLHELASHAPWLARLLRPGLASASIRVTPRHIILYVPQ